PWTLPARHSNPTCRSRPEANVRFSRVRNSGLAEELGLAHRNLGALIVPKAGDAGAVDVGRRAGEDETFSLAGHVEIIDVGGAEAELDGAGRILIRGGVEREPGLAGVELAPERRLKAGGQPQRI